MRQSILLTAALMSFAIESGAQTPIQQTGSLQTGVAVQPKAPIAASQSISIEGITPGVSSELSSTAPDSGPQPWKDVMGWISLHQGQSADEVRALLGIDYRENVTAKGTMWSYQDQKALLFGSVMFKDGKLESWNSPRF